MDGVSIVSIPSFAAYNIMIRGCELRHVLLGIFILLSVVVCSSAFSNHKHPRPGQIPHNTDNREPTEKEKTVVIAYHKPANVITSHSDEQALSEGHARRSTVYDDIQSMKGWVIVDPQQQHSQHNNNNWQRATGIHSKLHAIGRLDCDTTGLLLLTNDGGLVHHVTNPNAKSNANKKKKKKSISKTYHAVIMGYHEQDCDSFQQMRTEGMDIGSKYGGVTRPVIDLTVLDHPTPKSTQVSITIGEGRNRQVRRMFHAMGSGVMKLKRVQIGDNLTLDGIEQEGQWRILAPQEVSRALEWSARNIQQKQPRNQQSTRKRNHTNNNKPTKATHGTATTTTTTTTTTTSRPERQ
ncbi:Ribosomal small subunit pseudouridine synthase A [Seminavis robusta]|uniref:Ribosomal small subunit pseudouridine synthase A n=1 Tax=Seminavis robusta TaxID=568900 RepID=A0A9N8DY66_9STRA|nr:Ribosomal small subunit pseudouridine synthase A [Seminavis robusta]|eukprot:Sro361_g126560.1 Ribosomal small subunit pseudouridine synthase A (351) ;mRNA; r:44223-45275